MLIKTLKYLGWSILIFLAFCILYLVASYVLSRIPVAAEENTDEDITIYILTSGVHTDIVVPTRTEQIDWSKQFKFDHIQSNDSTYKYLAIGWGDKGFYMDTPTWAELKASVAFRAAFALSTTAIHTTYHHKMEVGEDCRAIKISNGQYQRLIDYIHSYLETDANGQSMNIETDANYYDTDAFYEAHGTYSLFLTCNTWANKALKSCGQRHCLWTPFDTGIFLLHEQ